MRHWIDEHVFANDPGQKRAVLLFAGGWLLVASFFGGSAAYDQLRPEPKGCDAACMTDVVSVVDHILPAGRSTPSLQQEVNDVFKP